MMITQFLEFDDMNPGNASAGLSEFWETWKYWNYHGKPENIMGFCKNWPEFFSNAVLGFYRMTIFQTV